MNAKIIRRLDMLKCIVSFMSQLPILALPRATAALAEIVVIIQTLEEAARDQVGGNGRKEGAVDVRESIANELREYLKDVNRTARSFDADQPSLRPIFRLPKSGSYPALIATARNIIAVSSSMETAFLDAGMPATFLSELRALLTKFEEATGEKISGRLARVKATAALKHAADRGVLAATKLDACVRNHFRNQPEILAAWIQARHIQRNPVRKRAISTAGTAKIAPESKLTTEENRLAAPHAPSPAHIRQQISTAVHPIWNPSLPSEARAFDTA